MCKHEWFKHKTQEIYRCVECSTLASVEVTETGVQVSSCWCVTGEE